MNKKTRICIITSIFHGFGKQGGFGVMARSLAKSLVGEGYDVIIAVPRRRGQQRKTAMEGYKVLGLGIFEMINPRTYKKIDADLYHSQSPNFMSTVAMLAQRGKKHVITCRDPRNLKDWVTEIKNSTLKRRIKNLALTLFEEGPAVTWTVRNADAVGYAADHLKQKIKKMYQPKVQLTFLPNIENMPKKIPEKARRPKACFIGRLDRRKRPELFIGLAEHFADVEFVMIGKAEEKRWQCELEGMAKNCKNLKMLGYIDKFTDEKRFYESFEDSWIFINTASREAFPLTFFEAGGRGCALLSHVNPDDTARKFGYWAKEDDFEEGLHWLLEQDRWKNKGEEAFAFFTAEYNEKEAVKKHVNLYEKLLGRKNPKKEMI